jgi:hypothetical protein
MTDNIYEVDFLVGTTPSERADTQVCPYGGVVEIGLSHYLPLRSDSF